MTTGSARQVRHSPVGLRGAIFICQNLKTTDTRSRGQDTNSSTSAKILYWCSLVFDSSLHFRKYIFQHVGPMAYFHHIRDLRLIRISLSS